MRGLLLGSMLLLAGTAQAQQASYTYINQPPRYWIDNNPSALFALNLPRIGQTFRVQTLLGCEAGFFLENFTLLTGLRQPNFDLGPFGIPGMLYSSAEVSMSTGHGGSNCGLLFVIRFVIPSNPALVGASFYQQTLLTNFVGPAIRIRLGRGGHGIIGT